jgi:hypothetical protein
MSRLTLSNNNNNQQRINSDRNNNQMLLDKNSLSWLSTDMHKYSAEYYTIGFEGRLDNLKKESIYYSKKKCDIYIHPKPFAKGSIRFAHCALLLSNSGKTCYKQVVKRNISPKPNDNDLMAQISMIENQIIAAFLANQFFNLVSSESKNLKFIDVNLIHVPHHGIIYTIEDYVEGQFFKWTNNYGYVNQVTLEQQFKYFNMAIFNYTSKKKGYLFKYFKYKYFLSNFFKRTCL